jgi:outer membrane protein TolC
LETAAPAYTPPAGDPSAASQAAPAAPPLEPEIATVSHATALSSEAGASAIADDPFAGAATLSLPHLVSEVQQRNPSLQAALAAWSAAAERYPQAVAFDDPMLQSMFAPASFAGSSNVQSSYTLGVAQKVPWSGKRQLRGEMARWDSAAAQLDFQDAQLRLAQTARLAFFDYYLVQRETELNLANLRALEEFRDTANAKYELNQVTQQDVLQAEVELAKTQQRQIELDQTDQVTRARINTLLHRLPDRPLPPPPLQLEVGGELPDVQSLRQVALEQRPDLAAQAARLHSEQNAVALACKEFYPDFEFSGRYDAFWTDHEQRPQVGMNMNIPLNQRRRHAAVREAAFRVSKLQAEYNQQVDNIRNDVQAAYLRLAASRKTVRLYAESILPAAQSNVAAAVAGYTAGSVDFLRLIQAQRELFELQERNQMAIAEYHRNLAELERMVGTPVADWRAAPDAEPGL